MPFLLVDDGGGERTYTTSATVGPSASIQALYSITGSISAVSSSVHSDPPAAIGEQSVSRKNGGSRLYTRRLQMTAVDTSAAGNLLSTDACSVFAIRAGQVATGRGFR